MCKIYTLTCNFYPLIYILMHEIINAAQKCKNNGILYIITVHEVFMLWIKFLKKPVSKGFMSTLLRKNRTKRSYSLSNGINISLHLYIVLNLTTVLKMVKKRVENIKEIGA